MVPSHPSSSSPPPLATTSQPSVSGVWPILDISCKWIPTVCGCGFLKISHFKRFLFPSKNWAKDLNRHLVQDDIRMINKPVERDSKSDKSLLRKLQIITRSYHCTPIRGAEAPNTDHSHCRRGRGESHRRGHTEWHSHVGRRLGGFLHNQTRSHHTIQQVSTQRG